MSTGFVAKFRATTARLFPERQIYHRSRGEVHFVTVAARTQMILIAGTLGFLTWVAFTSVNVVFKEQIIDANIQRQNEMQANYEARLNRTQREIDRVNAAARITQESFGHELELLNQRQDQLEILSEDQGVLLLEHENIRSQVAVMGDDPMRDDPDGTSSMLMTVGNREPSLRESRPLPPVRHSSVDGVSMVLTNIARGGENVRNALTSSATRVAGQEAQARALRTAQRDTILRIENQAVDRITRFETILASTGLNIDAYMANFLDDEFTGMGGPALDLDILETYFEDDEDTEDFSRHLMRTSAHLDRLAVLQVAVSNLPLLRPTDIYRLSSPFGMRRDPFTRRLTSHHGLDFAGPEGTPVMATASGTVTRSGNQSGYGRVIYIDHGNGFQSRFGHLRSTAVRVGDVVTARQVIGQLGNTGRSTGAHVHYELRFQGEPLNPIPFLEAGRHVFES